jgi:hypothetical protein
MYSVEYMNSIYEELKKEFIAIKNIRDMYKTDLGKARDQVTRYEDHMRFLGVKEKMYLDELKAIWPCVSDQPFVEPKNAAS